MQELLEGIEEAVHDTLFQRDNCILGNGNRFGAHLPAAGCDVTVTDSCFIAVRELLTFYEFPGDTIPIIR